MISERGPCVVYANSTLIAPILFTVVYRGYSRDYCIYKGKILIPGWDVKFPAPHCVNCICKSTGLQCCGYVTGQEKLIISPQPKGVGHIAFGADSVGVHVASFSCIFF